MRLFAGGVALIGLTVALAMPFVANRLLRSPCDRESAYYCIRIDEMEQDLAAGMTLRLVLDRLVHSQVWLLDPRRLSYSYIRAYADVTAHVAARKPDFRALLIGAGGYGLARYLEATYPSSDVHVLEIDPALTAVSHERLGLSRRTRVVTHVGDARATIAAWHDAPRYDIVFGDAFNDLSMPYHLTTREFDAILADLLTDDGVYLANVIDSYDRHGDVFRAFLTTVGGVFPHTYLLRWGPADPGGLETLVVAGSKAQLDLKSENTRVVDPVEVAAFLGRGRRTLLTDDYAPIDQLTAPLAALRE